MDADLVSFLRHLESQTITYVITILGLLTAFIMLFLGFGVDLRIIRPPSAKADRQRLLLLAILLFTLIPLWNLAYQPNSYQSASCDFRNHSVAHRSEENKATYKEAITTQNLSAFSEQFLSYELAHAIGIDVTDELATQPTLDNIARLLKVAGDSRDAVAALNIVELAGNLGLHLNPQYDSYKKSFAALIETISSQYHLVADLQEVCELKLAILTDDTLRVIDLIEQVEHRNHSWYEHDIFEEPTRLFELLKDTTLGYVGQLFAGSMIGFVVPATESSVGRVSDLIREHSLSSTQKELISVLVVAKQRLAARRDSEDVTYRAFDNASTRPLLHAVTGVFLIAFAVVAATLFRRSAIANSASIRTSYQDVLSASPIPTWTTTIQGDTLVVESINSEFEALFQIQASKFIGKSFGDFYHACKRAVAVDQREAFNQRQSAIERAFLDGRGKYFVGSTVLDYDEGSFRSGTRTGRQHFLIVAESQERDNNTTLIVSRLIASDTPLPDSIATAQPAEEHQADSATIVFDPDQTGRAYDEIADVCSKATKSIAVFNHYFPQEPELDQPGGRPDYLTEIELLIKRMLHQRRTDMPTFLYRRIIPIDNEYVGSPEIEAEFIHEPGNSTYEHWKRLHLLSELKSSPSIQVQFSVCSPIPSCPAMLIVDQRVAFIALTAIKPAEKEKPRQLQYAGVVKITDSRPNGACRQLEMVFESISRGAQSATPAIDSNERY